MSENFKSIACEGDGFADWESLRAKRFIRKRKWRCMTPPISSKKTSGYHSPIPYYQVFSGIETKNLFVINEGECEWRITHKATGRSIGRFLAPMKEIYALLDEFEALGNWSGDPTQDIPSAQILSRAVGRFANANYGKYWRT